MDLENRGPFAYRASPHFLCRSPVSWAEASRNQHLLPRGPLSVTDHSARRLARKVPELGDSQQPPKARRDDEWLAVVSHELRGPVSSIHNAICTLRSTAIDATSRQRMQALIERQVGRLILLIDDLTDMARLTSARLRLKTERIDLRVVLRQAIETVGPDITQRKHRLDVVLPESPVWIPGDSGRLEQVFVNLLTNASKYTHTGGEISVWLHAKAGHAVVRIRDSGIGIATDMLAEIFEMFKQTDAAIQHSNTGLGIGLALVRNLVESHGGRVTAASAGRDQGSEFTVRLPRHEAADESPSNIGLVKRLVAPGT
jgi:two-component system CheB/CheR fusion protein